MFLHIGMGIYIKHTKNNTSISHYIALIDSPPTFFTKTVWNRNVSKVVQHEFDLYKQTV